jgi:predicted RNase H-like HicB family nuclease
MPSDWPKGRVQRGYATFANASIRIVFANEILDELVRDEDGTWIAECPSIPGCVSQGETQEEAMTNIRETIAACLEVRAERGMPLTIETRQVEVQV